MFRQLPSGCHLIYPRTFEVRSTSTWAKRYDAMRRLGILFSHDGTVNEHHTKLC